MFFLAQNFFFGGGGEVWGVMDLSTIQEGSCAHGYMQVATGQVASTGMVLLSYVQKASEKVHKLLVGQ